MDWLEVDSKAMRRLKQTQIVVLVINNAAEAGGGAVDVVFGLRGLIAA